MEGLQIRLFCLTFRYNSFMIVFHVIQLFSQNCTLFLVMTWFETFCKEKQVTLLQHFSNFFFKMLQGKKKCFIVYSKAFDCVDHNKLWKILQEIGIPDHLICLLRNLYAGQEAMVRTGHGTTDWFQIGKGVHQGCILSPCLLTSCKKVGWMKHKLESRLPE